MWWDNTVKKIDANITVHENRASTDESIRLLQEMEDKVTEKILYSSTTKRNLLSAAVMVVSKDVMSHSCIAHASFNLNGKDYHIKENIDMLSFPSKNDFINHLLKIVSTSISREITVELLRVGLNDGGLDRFAI